MNKVCPFIYFPSSASLTSVLWFSIDRSCTFKNLYLILHSFGFIINNITFLILNSSSLVEHRVFHRFPYYPFNVCRIFIDMSSLSCLLLVIYFFLAYITRGLSIVLIPPRVHLLVSLTFSTFLCQFYYFCFHLYYVLPSCFGAYFF